MKQGNHFKRLLGVVLGCVLGISLYGTKCVFAAPPTSTGTEANPAEVKIWKNIQMPVGVNTPAGTATFEFTSYKVDGATATTTNMPVIPNRTITFTTGDTGDADTTAAGVRTVSKKSGNILAGVTFPHAGEYLYHVKELASGFTLANTTSLHETMEYSTKEYQVQVVVANNAANTGVYVQSISVGVWNPVTSTVGTKVNDTDHDEGVGFGFTNKFNRTHIGSPTDPSAALQISKSVSGSAGNTTEYFPFSLQVEDPTSVAVGVTTGTYKAIIVEGGVAVDPTNNGITGAGADHSFSITAGAAFTFKLKHNQSLAFIDLPVGATYTVSETNAQGHTAYFKSTSNGVAGTEAAGSTSGAAKYITEGADIAAFRNNKDAATPTGILINNLPYILLIGFAGVVVLVVVNKKNKEELA